MQAGAMNKRDTATKKKESDELLESLETHKVWVTIASTSGAAPAGAHWLIIRSTDLGDCEQGWKSAR